ncbi:MAG TPA: helix-turn-helix transcriptional regulator [Microbacterium sp.]|nr:helix-turn-helix transcriptional regulator [Microbacterium sp.]
MTLDDRIRSWRKCRKLSQRALGAKIGVSGASIAQWEDGSTSPTHANLEKLVSSLELTMEQFYGPTPDEAAA